MAGDWIKFETITFDKPEVVAMADILDISELHVVGCLLWVWTWFDQHTTNGNTKVFSANGASVSKTFVDRKTSVPGFADAMEKVGWLTSNKDGLVLPNFDRHNGQTAKNRALTARRVQKHAAKKTNCDSVSPSLAEKRREDIPPKSPKGTRRAKSAQEGGSSEKRLNGQARTQIQNTRGPEQLSKVIARLGLGVAPAGMDFQQAKQWAIGKCSE